MDECGVWNVPLSPGAVQSLYAQEAINAGCMDSAACNYNEEAGMDDGSCHYLCNYCLEGTMWNEAAGGCVLDPSFCGWQPDSNDDQLIGVDDLLMFLSVFGDTDYDQDGVFDSADSCMDEEACNYLANPTEPCAFLDAAGICGGTCETDIEGDGVCDDPCPEGYAGLGCTEPVTPTSMVITDVHVLGFDPYDGAVAWDTNGTLPDIYISIWNSANTSELYTAEDDYILNAVPPTNGGYHAFNNVNLTVFPNNTYIVKLYDENTLWGDEIMGWDNDVVIFDGSAEAPFPTSKTYYGTNQFVFELFFEYTW